MTNVSIRPLAEEDLIHIWQYSYKQWGEERADCYLDDLYDAMQSISEFEFLGMSLDELPKEYRYLKINNHYIFYIVDDEAIEVIRVLGEEMDMVKHL